MKHYIIISCLVCWLPIMSSGQVSHSEDTASEIKASQSCGMEVGTNKSNTIDCNTRGGAIESKSLHKINTIEGAGTQRTDKAESQAAFFELGKSWIYKTYDPYVLEKEPMFYKVSVVGDTIVNGTLSTRLRLDFIGKEQDYTYTAGYEENGMIYGFLSECEGFVPMIDFNVKTGDPINDNRTVANVETIDIEGISRRIITITDINGEDPYYWIEGIGANIDLSYITDYPRPIGHVTELLECYIGDKLIFSKDILDKYNDIDGVYDNPEHAAGSGIIYDMLGRKINKPIPGHLYIRDGKKYIAH